ncbi:hypothetical protein KF913_00050 [Candidatus Obscuribacterales bacterium]|nr:hypothetical protein [Candidatus Obscuribacterales bacterium]
MGKNQLRNINDGEAAKSHQEFHDAQPAQTNIKPEYKQPRGVGNDAQPIPSEGAPTGGGITGWQGKIKRISNYPVCHQLLPVCRAYACSMNGLASQNSLQMFGRMALYKLIGIWCGGSYA